MYGGASEYTEDGLGIAVAPLIGGAVSVANSLFGGRSGEEVAHDIATVLARNATAAAMRGDLNGAHYMGTKAGILPEYMVTTAFNFYDPSKKDYKDYQAQPGGWVRADIHPGATAVFQEAYMALPADIRAAVEQTGGTSGVSVGGTVPGGYPSTAKAGVSPLMLGIGVAAAVMLTSMARRR